MKRKVFFWVPVFLQSVDSPVSKQDKIDVYRVHSDFRACHFIYCHPHSTATLTPVVLQYYTGDRHAEVGRGKLAAATPERPDAEPASGFLNMPGRSAAVVMEQ